MDFNPWRRLMYETHLCTFAVVLRRNFGLKSESTRWNDDAALNVLLSTRRRSNRVSSDFNHAIRITKRVKLRACCLRDTEVEVAEWRAFGAVDESSAFHTARASACDQNRKIIVVVAIAVANRAAVKDDC